MKIVNWKTKEEKECDTKVYSNNMDEIVECPECGKKFRFEQMYNVGDWYEPKFIWNVGICPECAEKHWEKETKKNG